MASHWMREVSFVDSNNVFRPLKFMNLFMRYVLGYTYVSETVGSGSFQSTEKNGSDGSFTGSSFRFTDTASSSFVSGDVGKWLLIVDSTNPENCGWYKITNYVDADNVDIDFKTAATEYPTSASSLTWYVLGESYDLPGTADNLSILQTPHTDAWEVELKAIAASTHIEIRISLDGDWTATGKILGPAWGSRTISASYNPTYYYIEGDSDGSYFHLISFYTGYQEMSSMVQITPWETSPAHSADEKWALMGHTINSGVIDRKPTTSGWGHLYLWRDKPSAQFEGEVLEWSSSTGDTYGFTQYAAREINARTGKNDVMNGSHGIVDSGNTVGQFEYIGLLGGHQSIRNNLSKMQTIDYSGGTKNRIHIADGIMLQWPGYTPQYTP